MAPSESPRGKTYRTTRKIEFADTDMAGIVHFSRFFVFMETAELEFLAALDAAPVFERRSEAILWPRVKTACDYMRPARFGDDLQIALSIEEIGTKSVRYALTFSNETEAIARGSVIAVCCSYDTTGRLSPIPIPDSVRTRLSAYVAQSSSAQT